MNFFGHLLKKKVNFNVCNMNRQNYYCILPNDMILKILNLMEDRLSLSKVNYQFYVVNRDYLSKCYQLHYYLPKVKSLITKDEFIVIHFKESISLYKFSNVRYSNNVPDNINIYEKNLLTMIENISSPLNRIRIEHYIMDQQLILPFMTSSDMHDIIQYLPYIRNISSETIEKITRIIMAYGQEILLLEKPNLQAFIYRLIRCEPKFKEMLELYIKIAIPMMPGLRLDDFIEIFTTMKSQYDKINLAILTITSMSYKNLLKHIEEKYHRFLELINFTVDDKCLYIINGKALKSNIPEYQWFANQLY